MARRIRISIVPHRHLTIYNPEGPQHPRLPDKVPLIGEVHCIRGNDWLIFKEQRGFGLPLVYSPTDGEHIDCDLETALAMGDIIVEKLSEETMP